MGAFGVFATHKADDADTHESKKQAIDWTKTFGLSAESMEVLSDFNTMKKSGFYHAKGANRPSNDELKSFI